MSQTYPYPVFSDEFAGKRVLVTGSTKGTGEAIVERFRIAGALVATTARRTNSSRKGGSLRQSRDMIQDIARNQNIPEDAALQVIMDMPGGIPLGRPGKPVEVAELSAFLASERGAFCNGVTTSSTEAPFRPSEHLRTQ